MMESESDKRNYKNWILGAALVVLALTFGGTRGLAQEWYLWDFNGTYGTDLSALDTCKLCHPGHPFSLTINSFGSDYALDTLGNHTFNQALEDEDSDDDGFTNIQEIEALTFPGDPASQPPPGATLDNLSINGPPSVNEGDTASYEASASWSDGSTTTESADWTVSPETFATISASGLLTALEVTSDQEVTVSATVNGTTATRTVMIVNVPGDIPPLPADAILLKPEDGAVDIPVTAVVVATLNGSGDIAEVVNDNTFSLSVAESDRSTCMERVYPDCIADGVVLGTIDYNDSHTEATFTPLYKLANSTGYTATVRPATGTQQQVLAEPVSSTFTTIAKTPDSDDDGVEDGEDDHPHDNGKATPPCVRGSGKFLVDTYGNAGIALANAEGISDMFPQFKRQGKPFGFGFPDGLVRFTLRGVSRGGTVTVTVSFPSGVPKGSKVFRVDGNGFQEWTNAVVNGNRVTVTLTDGGEGDADETVNGVIEDPIGVAVPEDAGGSADISSSVSSAGGCSVAGSGGGYKEAFGSFGLIALVWLGLALRRRKPGIGA
jgi:MYXO-CTERM domain-containing protein